VDTGDVVCFSSDDVLRILEALGGTVEDYNAFVARFGGIPCGFHADGRYPVDRLIAVADDGKTRDVVVIGGDWKRFQRFLRAEEPTLDEFLDGHPRKADIGTGEGFRLAVFRRLCAEYRRQRMGGRLPENDRGSDSRHERFSRLAAEWKKQSRYLSNTAQMALLKPYQRIIGMGPPVVPLILEELRREPDQWFWALESITEQNPVPQEAVGKVRLMAEAWIGWGEQLGLIAHEP
jgi:hypothetical protein